MEVLINNNNNTTNSNKEVLDRYLVELHLPGIRCYYEEWIRLATKESFSYESFLLGLLEREREERYNNRVSRLLRESKLPLEKKLENFDLKRLPIRVCQQVKSLLDGHFVERRENVLVFGNPGSGKTHLLCAIGQELVRKSTRVLFTTCNRLVQELLVAKRDLKLVRLLKRFSKFEAIIIDDIGYVEQNREEMEVLFTLISERYERGSLLISSNLPFSKWEIIFKSPMVTAAAIDRLVHHSVVIELNLESYRMAHALKGKHSLNKKIMTGKQENKEVKDG
jgi:DNA replication protein DnaC